MIEEDSQNEGQDDDNDGNAAQELGENYDWIELEKKMGYVKRRRSCRIIRFYKPDSLKDKYKFAYHMLMLYHPWKTQKDDLDDINILSLYTEKSDALLTSHAEFSLLDEDALENFAQFAMNQDHEEEEEGEDNQDSEYVNSGNADDFRMHSLLGDIAVDINDEINGYQETEADSGPVPDQSFSTNAGASSRTASTRNNGGTAARYTRPDRIDKLEYESLLSKLNMEQRDFLTHVMNHVRHENFDESPLRLFVTGGAGTGKSLLIKTLFQSLIRHYDVDRSKDLTSNSVILTAFTGKAAFNIYGQTLHTAFHFPNSQTDIHELSSDISNTMTAALAELKVVIIDEISLVSTRHFLWIDKRLRDIFGRDLPFGGRHMLFFGDFNQLPPVHDFSFYKGFPSDPTKHLKFQDLWHSFKAHYLTQIMRQKDYAKFAVALNNMALGTMTPDDIKIFSDHTFNSIPAEALVEGKEIIRLYSTNEEVYQCNEAILSGMTSAVYESKCYDKVTLEKSSAAVKDSLLEKLKGLSHNRTAGLPYLLNLRIGARYMITINIDTSDGLVSGTTGILKQVDFGTSASSVEKPLRIWLLMEDERSGKVQRKRVKTNSVRSPDWVPIDYTNGTFSVKVERASPVIRVQRTQLPVVVANKITKIRKIQNVCSLFKATTAAGLFIIAKKFIPKTAPDPKYDIAIELKRLETVKLKPKFYEQRLPCTAMKIISNNVQSLNAHVTHITNDQVYMTSDVICYQKHGQLKINNLTFPDSPKLPE
ncbi:hypothetical protein INT47_006013 [Mucor saturninus]|uniref:ATP-dependent DNA helicase n=1 Tax=Mucor saturninus TaxID=64648 RepID=A0A8H7QFQ1_9FUNG|nr:hypothetical protein INT47_006013 [Mucor saturninus]